MEWAVARSWRHALLHLWNRRRKSPLDSDPRHQQASREVLAGRLDPLSRFLRFVGQYLIRQRMPDHMRQLVRQAAALSNLRLLGVNEQRPRCAVPLGPPG